MFHQMGQVQDILPFPIPTLTSSSRLFRVFPPRKAPSPWRQQKGNQSKESRKVFKRHPGF